MALSAMYPAKAGSPKTVLAITINATATQMTVADASVLPAAPNLAVLGSDSSAEIVSYAGKSGNTLTGLVRGLGGTTASVWESDTIVARNITSFDHDRFITNINALDTDKVDAGSLGALATADSIDYTSAQLTNKPTLGSLAALSSIDYTSNYLTNKPTLGGIQVRADYTVSTTDLTDGTSSLSSGKLYFYYEA